MHLKHLFLAMAALMLSTNAALADQINGIWCSPNGKSVSIDGPNVTTSSGNAVDANYNRHHIDYEIPSGEPDAGSRFRADQLNDNQIQVVIVAAGGAAGEPEIWTPCRPVS